MKKTSIICMFVSKINIAAGNFNEIVIRHMTYNIIIYIRSIKNIMDINKYSYNKYFIQTSWSEVYFVNEHFIN